MPEALKFAVHAQGASPAKTIINTRNFQFVIDEPADLGGTDEAPNPVEYLLASYAGCLNVVAHIVAKELKFRLKDLSITIEGVLNPARLLGQSFEKRAGYQCLDVKLLTSTNLDAALKLRWLKEIEARCPINDNLINQTPINIEIKNLLQTGRGTGKGKAGMKL